MIKANELRIGNIINIESKYKRYNELFIEVESINSTEINTDYRPYELNHCIGIQLTEEILLKCGFHDFNGWYTKDKLEIYKTKISFYIPKFSIKLKYVHQLQNLYFALTNEELTIQL